MVGGCVRDSLLGIEPHDWDICTSATPQEVIDILTDYEVIPTGIKHGTVTAISTGNLTSVNDSIKQTVEEIDTYVQRLSETRDCLNTTHDKNERIMQNFAKLTPL